MTEARSYVDYINDLTLVAVAGLVAYTVPSNKAMINLFKTLPYKVTLFHEDGDLLLSCRFDDLAE